MLIPGGAHTYAKGDDQFPELSPGFIARGLGCHVWDVDGNEFIEYGMGLRSVTLGHAYGPVVEAAHRQMLMGNNFTRPAAIELECAEKVLSLIDGADMAKFAKDGSSVTTAAVKLARAYTGKDMVAICAEHPFISYDDWFIGTTAMSTGIPQVIRDLTVSFRYNDLDSAKAVFDTYGGKIACVIMEPVRSEEPEEGYLHNMQALCHDNDALFVLDEMITGFRWHIGGAQRRYGIVPDLSTFGKGMANGFAISALLGKREIMELGGLMTAKERVFLLSTTHGAENHALAAAIASITVYETADVIEYLYRQGSRLVTGINQAIDERGLRGYVDVVGHPANLTYVTRDAEHQSSQHFRTLFLQELIARGVLAPSLVVSFSHTDGDIDRTIAAIADSLCVYKRALDEGIDKYVIGRPVKPAFRRFA